MNQDLKRILVVASVFALLMAASAALAVEEPEAGRKDRRVMFVDYDPYNIVRVTVAMRTSFQVVFAKEEKIRDIAAGNTVAWEVAPSENILFLKPRENHPSTNLQVVTARADGSTRAYQLELVSVSAEQIKGSDAAVFLEYRYPSDEAKAAREAARQEAVREEGQAAGRQLARHEERGPRNFAYTAQGSSLIEPSEVFDNGKVTSFRFAGNQETPAIYMVGQDGSEQLVPKNVVGELTQVHGYAAKYVLRLGREVMCVVNENYVQGGLATGTMTTSPAVERVVAKPQGVRARALPPLLPVRTEQSRTTRSSQGTSTGSLGPVPMPTRGAQATQVASPVSVKAKSEVGAGPVAVPVLGDMDRITIRPQAAVEKASAPPQQRQPDLRVIQGGLSEAKDNIGDTIVIRGAGAGTTASEERPLSVAQEIARENLARQVAANGGGR